MLTIYKFTTWEKPLRNTDLKVACAFCHWTIYIQRPWIKNNIKLYSFYENIKREEGEIRHIRWKLIKYVVYHFGWYISWNEKYLKPCSPMTVQIRLFEYPIEIWSKRLSKLCISTVQIILMHICIGLCVNVGLPTPNQQGLQYWWCLTTWQHVATSLIFYILCYDYYRNI